MPAYPKYLSEFKKSFHSVKNGSNWKDVPQIYVKNNNTWKELYEYKWNTGAWSLCNVPCGGGIQTRVVNCKRNDNILLDDSLCIKLVGTKPTESTSCNTQACSINTSIILGADDLGIEVSQVDNNFNVVKQLIYNPNGCCGFRSDNYYAVNVALDLKYMYDNNFYLRFQVCDNGGEISGFYCLNKDGTCAELIKADVPIWQYCCHKDWIQTQCWYKTETFYQCYYIYFKVKNPL